VIFLAVAVMVFWLRMGGGIGRLRWSLLLVIVVLVAANAFGVAPVIADLKAQIGPIDQLSDDDPQRQQFGLWHGISAILHLIATISAALLVALGRVRSESEGAQ